MTLADLLVYLITFLDFAYFFFCAWIYGRKCFPTYWI